MKHAATIIAIITASAAWPHTGRAQPPPEGGDKATVAALERTLVDVIARAEKSVVAIARVSPPQQSLLQPNVEDVFGNLRSEPPAAVAATTTAAGVIIDPAGLVLTEYLAVREGDTHTVTTIDGKSHPATIKAADPRSGLAILAIAPNKDGKPGNYPTIPLGNAATLRKGQFVIAIGNPYAIRSDGEPTASWGTVTNLARKAPTGTNLNDAPGPAGDYRTTLHHLGTLIQTDAKLGWNAGGGALINTQGELVGLTTTVSAIAGHEQPAGYAIPIDDSIRRIIDTLKQGREVEYGLLGVRFQPVDPNAKTESASSGMLIQQVYQGSPAARAGLQDGDIITRVNNKPVDDGDSVQLAVSIWPPLQPIQIEYQRGEHTGTVTAKLAKLAVPGKKIVTEQPFTWRGIRVDYATAIDPLLLATQSASGAMDPEGSVVIADVANDSLAWKAGVRPGMFMTQVAGKRVATPAEFRAAAEAANGTATVTFAKSQQQPASPATLNIPDDTANK